MIPHEQRCETCANCDMPTVFKRWFGRPYCNEADLTIGFLQEELIEHVGCCSWKERE